MSTNSECLFVEVAPGKWYYILEQRHPDAPKDAFSWLDYATAYGPFADENQTSHHLRDNHANPGSHSVIRYPRKLSPNVIKLIAECDNHHRTVNGHHAMRPSGRPRLMPTTQRHSTKTKRYSVVIVENVARRAVVEIDVLPDQDHREAERIVRERLNIAYTAPWSEPVTTILVSAERK